MNQQRRYHSPYWSCLRSVQLLWLALMIALFGALAPTWSLALNAPEQTGPSMLDICSSDPALMADGTAPRSPDLPAPPGMLKHCPLCLHHAHPFALPPPTMLTCLAALGEPVVPIMAQVWAADLADARIALPRGPPARQLAHS